LGVTEITRLLKNRKGRDESPLHGDGGPLWGGESRPDTNESNSEKGVVLLSYVGCMRRDDIPIGGKE